MIEKALEERITPSTIISAAREVTAVEIEAGNILERLSIPTEHAIREVSVIQVCLSPSLTLHSIRYCARTY